MPVQLTLRSTKSGRVINERTYEGGRRIDAVSGWLVVVDRTGSVIAAHTACPGLEGAVVEHTSAAVVANPDGVARGEEPILATDDEDDGGGEPGPEPVHSDGYLDDAETWGTREELARYARNAGHGALPTREVLALIRLDRILGNERALSERGTGRVRGVVLQALRDWHTRQRAVVDSIGLGPADPDGGPYEHEGTEPLGQQIGRLADWIMENVPGEPSRSEGAVDCAIRLLADYLRRRAEWDTRSEEGRQQVDRLVASNDDLRRQLAEQRSLAAARAGTADTYRREVEEQTARAEREHARAEREVTRGNDALAVVDRLRAWLDNFRREDWSPHTRGAAGASWLVKRPERIAASIEDLVLGERIDDEQVLGPPARYRHGVSPSGLRVADPVPHEPIDLRPVEEDPRRPHPDAWPDDAVLLRYVELRRLVALHLERYADSRTARSMLEGDVPLRLSEVLDR